jgi:hydroxyacylglutathione hydrolase
MVELLFSDDYLEYKIYRTVTNLFNVNTYFIIEEKSFLIIDPGRLDKSIYSWLDEYKFKKFKIFITHEHFDHHFDLKKIQEKYDTIVYIPNETFKKALEDEKTNLSYYFNYPVSYSIKNMTDLSELLVFKTPGHSVNSYCFKFRNFLFSGDTIVNKANLVLKLPGSNKIDFKKSILFLNKYLNNDTIILPGHGNYFKKNKES